MAQRQMHLNRGPAGMASRTACGRNILRTPMSTDWAGFTGELEANRCAKCAASKQAEVNARQMQPKKVEEEKITSIYSMTGKRMVYQIGSIRAVVDTDKTAMTQVKIRNEWITSDVGLPAAGIIASVQAALAA